MKQTATYLDPGTYHLLPTCTAIIRGGKIIVSVKKRPHLRESQTPRCRNCAHYGMGYVTGCGNYGSACLLRPKSLKWASARVTGNCVYYHTSPLTKACPDFQPKPDNQ